MASKEIAKTYTPMQQAFLNHLATDAKGDMQKAKELAGYSENTMVSEIVKPLKDEILEISKEILAYGAIKAAVGLVDVIERPSQLGAANKTKAATEVLDRVGVTKKEEPTNAVPQGTIFILPPKNASVKVTVDDHTPNTIDITPTTEASDDH